MFLRRKEGHMSWTFIYIIGVALFCFFTHILSWNQGYDEGWDAAFDKVVEILNKKIEEIEDGHTD